MYRGFRSGVGVHSNFVYATNRTPISEIFSRSNERMHLAASLCYSIYYLRHVPGTIVPPFTYSCNTGHGLMQNYKHSYPCISNYRPHQYVHSRTATLLSIPSPPRPLMSSSKGQPQSRVRFVHPCGNCGKLGDKKENKACSSCRVARYCSMACQTGHWKVHKPDCQRIADYRAKRKKAGLSRMPMKMLKQIIQKYMDLLTTRYAAKRAQGLRGIQFFDLEKSHALGCTVITFYTEQQCMTMRDRTQDVSWDLPIVQIKRSTDMIVGTLGMGPAPGHGTVLASLTCGIGSVR